MCNSLFNLVAIILYALVSFLVYIYMCSLGTQHYECEFQDELLIYIISVFPLACALSSLYEQLAVLDGCPPFL